MSTSEPGLALDTAGAAATPAVLRAHGVTRILPGPVPVTLVRDIDLEIDRGEFVSITGPSGSGKSSLLYLLGLLDTPTRGGVLIDGVETSEMTSDEMAETRLAKIGFVFQFHFLLPEFSVLDNVMVPMRKLGEREPDEMRDRAETLLADLGLGDQTRKRPDQLSGGQRQRVAIARALSNEPAVILADEPTGSLDQKSSQIVVDIFRKLVDSKASTVVMVTHEPELAAQTSREVHLVDGAIMRDTRQVPVVPDSEKLR